MEAQNLEVRFGSGWILRFLSKRVDYQEFSFGGSLLSTTEYCIVSPGWLVK